jgi:CDP-diacylglycerol---glycerol-3-phosphate 3-phosphatidyltransferase
VINAKIRDRYDRVMRPIGRALARTPISPNAITVAGVGLQAVVTWQIVTGHILVAGLLGIASGFADAFDGAVAKAKNMTSKFGALLDSTTDRLADGMIFGAIAWLYGVSPDVPARDEPWVAALALGTLVVSFMVSYIKARAEALGFDCNVGLVERAERLVLINAALILDLVPPLLVVLFVLSVVTFFQRLVHVRAQREPAAG